MPRPASRVIFLTWAAFLLVQRVLGIKFRSVAPSSILQTLHYTPFNHIFIVVKDSGRDELGFYRNLIVVLVG